MNEFKAIQEFIDLGYRLKVECRLLLSGKKTYLASVILLNDINTSHNCQNDSVFDALLGLDLYLRGKL